MAITLRLDDEAWDLSLDPSGNISTITGNKEIAQSVANNVRLFKNDAYFATDEGIPHFTLDLGVIPNMSALKESINYQAMRVKGVVAADAQFLEFKDRALTGNIRLTTINDEVMDVNV